MKPVQKILVVQQRGSGEVKTAGIRRYGDGAFEVQTHDVDVPLPELIEDASVYLPRDIEADLVLDFLRHPDLSHDLALLCRSRNIPVVASGKKLRMEGIVTPPT